MSKGQQNFDFKKKGDNLLCMYLLISMQYLIQAREEIITETLNNNVYCKECDLANFDSIREFADRFKKKENRLDILINNAGVMRCPKKLTKQGIEMQLGTNHMGHFLLTNLLLDTMKVHNHPKLDNVCVCISFTSDMILIQVNCLSIIFFGFLA